MDIRKYWDCQENAIINSSFQLNESRYKKLVWIDENGDEQMHAIMSVNSQYWKPVVNDYPVEMDQAEKDALKNNELDQAYADRLVALNANTMRLAQKGYNYTSATYQDDKFGTTMIDQNNWSIMLGLKGSHTYDLENVVKNFDGEYYTIKSDAHIDEIVSQGMAFVNGYRASHKTLKDALTAIYQDTGKTIQQRIDEINIFVDDRT